MVPVDSEAATSQSDLELLTQLNAHYIRSVAESDVKWFEENLTEDFLNSNPDGSLVGKVAFLKQIAAPSTVPDLTCEDVRIRMFGDMAIIHARTRFTNSAGGRGEGRYTDVWWRRSGRWFCVAAHVNRR
jgi:ketosteroid isomerase-like protein